jgi:hypothetical protein
MKKLLAIIVFAIMISVAIPPAVSGDGAYVPGYITYNPGGGGNVEPATIVAIWETNGDYSLDDDTYSPGCQIDPPLYYNGYSDVWVYVAIYDPDDDIQYNTQIKIDISWPDNDIPERPELGDGSKAADNLEPVLDATWDEYMDAVNIDYGNNWPFICYYNQANDGDYPDGYEYINWQYYESNIKFKKARYDLYYHDPAGWYDAEVTIQGIYTDFQYNYFEYVYALEIDPDFSYLDWGGEHELYVWHAFDGNWVWDDYEEPPLPTIRNVGNWDTELGCHFGSGSFNSNDVLFDWRAGDSHPDSDYYNPTYSEANFISGMVPSIWYIPLPIDNDPWLGGDTDYDDVLLKCHSIKLDFYIYIMQWTNGAGQYYFDIDLYTGSPDWLPAPGYPCPLGEPD